MTVTTLLSLIVLSNVPAVLTLNHTANELLRRTLLKGYDSNAVPVDPFTGRAINVTVDFWPYDILYVVRKNDLNC